ncbi:hypothetical protein ACOSP7_030478 [Xanthoceras sorbifolium]
MSSMQNFPAAALFLCLVICSKFHFSASIPSGFRLKLISRDSPESPLYPGNLTQIERFQRLAQFSHAKANYLKFLSTSTSRNATLEPNNLYLPLLRDWFYYIAAIQIGTPPTKVFLMVDTGGGQIWTQCAPCKTCFHQIYPLFNSKSSSTYQKLPCSHPFCSGSNRLYDCFNGECLYTTTYGGGSVTRGYASMELFRFNDINGGPELKISNIIFGCSIDNHNFPFANRGLISGILGLSLSPDSLMSQFGDNISKRFSYCMASFAEGLEQPLVLRFGNDIPPHPGTIQTTPYFTLLHYPSYYLMTLLDITIGSVRLNLPPGVFRNVPGGQTLGFFIDSGAPMTMIDQHTNGVNAYAAVMTNLKAYYDSFGLERRLSSGAARSYELCYTDNPEFDQHPTITYHFQGADYVVDSQFSVVHFHDLGYFCSSIIPGTGVSILGADHQQNMRIIYDGNINSIQFYPENCAADHAPGRSI